MINLDTHVLVFALTGQIDARERRLLASQTWGISAIVHWELAKLVQLGRISIDLESSKVERALSNLRVWPIDLAVSLQSTRLDFKSDPADALIAATSIVHKVPLLTRDQRILKSGIVPFA